MVRTPDVLCDEILARTREITELISELKKWEVLLLPAGETGITADMDATLREFEGVTRVLLKRTEFIAG